MRILTTTRFFRLLIESRRGCISSIEEFQQSFDEFTFIVTELSNPSPDQTIIRVLNYTHVQLKLFRKLIMESDLPEYIDYFAHCAQKFLEAEQTLFYYKIRYPDRFVSVKDPISSPLFWSKKYYAIDLSEILFGMELLNPRPIVVSNGSDASFALVVRIFEKVLNVNLGDPYELKRSIINRKKNRAKFTVAIRYALENYEEK